MKSNYILFYLLGLTIFANGQSFVEPIPVGIYNSTTLINPTKGLVPASNGFGNGPNQEGVGRGTLQGFVLYSLNESVTAKNLQFTSGPYLNTFNTSLLSNAPGNIELGIYDIAGAKLYQSTSVAPVTALKTSYGAYVYFNYNFEMSDSIKLPPGKYYFSLQNLTLQPGAGGDMIIGGFELNDSYCLLPNAICDYVKVLNASAAAIFPDHLQVKNLPTSGATTQGQFFTSAQYFAPIFRFF